MSKSRAEVLAELNDSERQHFLKDYTSEELDTLLWDWRFWGRPEQQMPEGDHWQTWLILAGRGFGKTRVGAEAVRSWVCGSSPLARGKCERIALVAETAADARDVMVEGDSGILRCHPKDYRPFYEPTKRRLTWPNGAIATLYNGVEPDQLRGPQHDSAWCDELAKFRYANEAWDQLQFGLRLGINPRQVVTTTPKPIKVLRDIMKDPGTAITRGATYDNRANLAPTFLNKIITRYEGTRLGRQELNAEMLDDLPGALWDRDNDIDKYRMMKAPALRRIVVGVDPSGTGGEDEDGGNAIGIIAAGLGFDGRGYVLEDKTCQKGPAGWAREAVNLYKKHQADRLVAEVNYGGAMVEATIRTVDPTISYKSVTATRGKVVRAEPVAALYEQGKVSHIGLLSDLEDEMVQFTPNGYEGGDSPNRADALVWTLTELMLHETSTRTRDI
jgi:phage terminase large subunit-like protein